MAMRVIESKRRLSGFPWIIFWQKHSKPRLCYSPSDHRFYNLQSRLSDQWTTRRLGSCHGWLVLELGKIFHRQAVMLWNPISGVQIQLPMLEKVSSALGSPIISMSGPPIGSSDAECFIMIINDSSRIFLLRLGDAQWADIKSPSEVIRAVFCKGKFYCQCLESSNLLVVNPTADVLTSSSVHKMRVDMGTYRSSSYDRVMNYMVESDEEVLLAYEMFDISKSCTFFIILRADLSRNMWVMIESLGDRSLFLCIQGCCLSLPGTDIGRRGDFIYFKRFDYPSMWWEFDMKTGKLEDSPPLPALPPSIKNSWNIADSTFWFVPTQQ